MRSSKQWRRQPLEVGGQYFFPSPFPSLSFPFPSLSIPSLFLPLPLIHPLRSRTPENQLRGLGSAANFPSGVRGGAPAEKAFLAYFEPRKRVWWKRFSDKHIVSKYHVHQNLNITESYILQVTILISKQPHFSITHSCKACHKISV